MHELLAKSDRQLGMCLRMLYDEGMPGPLDVHSEINGKGKMEFHVLLRSVYKELHADHETGAADNK